MSPRITALMRVVIAVACLLTLVPVVAYAQTCPQPVIVTDPDVCPGSTGYANAEPPPVGTTYETFVWSIVNGTIPTPSNTSSVTFFATGEGAVELTLTITDNNGCQATKTTTIPLATLPPPEIELYEPSVCPGPSATNGYAMTVPPPPGTTYASWQWSIVNGTITYGETSSSASFTVDGSAPAELTLTVTDTRGCQSSSTIEVPIRTLPPPEIELYEPSVCPGPSATNGYAMTVPPPPGVTYSAFQWSIVNGTITYGATSSSVSFAVDGSAPAELTLVVTDNRGCTSTNSISVPIRTLPPPQIELYEPTVCPGPSATNGYATTVPPPPGITYSAFQWSIVNGTITYGATSSSVSFTVDGSAPAELTLVVTENRGCINTSSISVPIRTLPPPQIELYEPTVCPGSSATNGYATTVPPPPGITYSAFQWSIVNGTITYGATTSSVSFAVDGSAPAELTLVVTDNRGCTSSNSISVPIRTLPPPEIELEGPGLCPGGSAYAAAVPPPPGITYSAYQWSIVNGTITYGDTGSSVSFTANGSAPVELTLTVHDNRGCTATKTMTVPFGAAPPISVSNPNDCSTNWNSATIAMGAYNNITWTVTNGTILNGQGTFYLEFAGNGNGAVTISVEATEVGGTCSGTNSVVIPGAIEPVELYAPDSVCPGVLMKVGGSELHGHHTFNWSITNATIEGPTDQPDLYFRADGTGPVVVSATAVSYWGCPTSHSVTIPLGGMPQPEIQVNHEPVCPGGGVNAYLYEPDDVYGTYQWSVTNATVVETYGDFVSLEHQPGTGDITVTLTVGEGACTTTVSRVIPVIDAVEPVLELDTTAVCPNGTRILYWDNYDYYSTKSISVVNGSVISTQPGRVAGGRTITVKANGGGDVTVYVFADSAACYQYRILQIPLIPAAASITASGSTNFCEGGSVTLTANSGSAYLWSNGATTQSITVSQSGTYTVTVSQTNGCSNSASRTVTVRPLPGDTITASGPTTFCQGGSVTLTAPLGTTYLWSNGATTRTINVSTSGTYTVAVTANSCTRTSNPITVTANAGPAATITASGPTAFCEGGSVTLTASAGASYLWSNGATTPSIDVTASGSYSVIVTNAAGCSTTSSATAVTVNANPVASISASGPTTFCEGGSVTLTASAGASYLWSNGATTPSIDVTASGSYSVIVTNAAGCSATSSATAVTVNANPAASITASGPTTFCEGGSVTLTASAGTSHLWSNGATTPSIVVSGAGNYSVIVTNAAGCSTTSSATTVTVNAAPVVAITPSGATTFCEGGSVTLTATEGASYSWSSGETTRSIIVSDTGNYSVTVTTASGCSASSAPTNVTVNDLAIAEITASGPTTFCTGGSVTLTATEGASYLWSNGATTRSINATTAGDYSVTVTNASGCSAISAATSVTVNANPAATISASGPTTFCAGGSVTLTASAGASWAWSNGATTQSITVSDSGSYSVAVTNAAGCTATSSATTVTVNPLPTPSISANGPTTFCEGGSVTLTGVGGAGTWYRNGVAYSAATSITINTVGSATFIRRMTTAAGCTADSEPVTVTVNPKPYIGNTSGVAAACWNTTSWHQVNDGPPGATFVWTATDASIVSGTNDYRVYYTPAAGATSVGLDVVMTTTAGCSVSKHFDIPVDRATPTINASGPTTFCVGGSVTLTMPTAPAGWVYLWSNNATTQSITVSSSGTYTARYVKLAGGCAGPPSEPVTVTVNPLPTATITPSGPTTFCEGGSVTLTASAGASSYLWSTGATTQSIHATTSGNYSVTVTNAAGCSTTSAGTVVTVNAAATPTITESGPLTFCEGGSVTLTASAGSSYLWSTGATSPSIDVTSTGSYTVTVTDANGCSAISAPKAVTVNAPPAATVSTSGSTSFCQGGSVTLTASAGASYLWSTGATTPSINVTTAGNYSVTVTNANGCSATSSDTAVTVNIATTPTISASGPTTFCSGGSVTLTASAGASYLWSTGQTSPSIVVTSSNNYTVTVTDANGCSATSAPKSVTVHPLPAASVSPAGPVSFCSGGTVRLTASAGTSYLWSNGATGSYIDVTAGGSYSVIVTNANGCSATSPVTTVTENANPATPTVTASGPTTFCAGGSVTLSAPAGPGFSYLWSTGAITPSINVNATGNYSVIVTNASGCSATSAPKSVTVNAATSITAQPQSKTIARNTTTQLSVTAAGTGPFTYQWYRGTSPNTAQPISGATNSSYTTAKLGRGTYTYWVRVTGACGVVNSTTATITVP